jgi:hypothetical protein
MSQASSGVNNKPLGATNTQIRVEKCDTQWLFHSPQEKYRSVPY